MPGMVLAGVSARVTGRGVHDCGTQKLKQCDSSAGASTCRSVSRAATSLSCELHPTPYRTPTHTVHTARSQALPPCICMRTPVSGSIQAPTNLVLKCRESSHTRRNIHTITRPGCKPNTVDCRTVKERGTAVQARKRLSNCQPPNRTPWSTSWLIPANSAAAL